MLSFLPPRDHGSGHPNPAAQVKTVPLPKGGAPSSSIGDRRKRDGKKWRRSLAKRLRLPAVGRARDDGVGGTSNMTAGPRQRIPKEEVWGGEPSNGVDLRVSQGERDEPS